MAFRQDVVYAVRVLRASPVFTLTAILSLTIGIGANAALFGLADALLLRPRAGIRDPSTLVDVGRTQRGSGFDNAGALPGRDVVRRGHSVLWPCVPRQLDPGAASCIAESCRGASAGLAG